LKKGFRSISVRLAFRFTLVLTVAILVLSISFALIIQSFVHFRQNSELIMAADAIEIIMKNDNFHNLKRNLDKNYSNNKNQNDKNENFQKRIPPPNPLIPYYITFVISDISGNILRTNDPFLPIFCDTDGNVETYFKKDFFIDGDLNIRYFAKKTEINGRPVLIQTSRDNERDETEKMFLMIPKSILFAILPIVIVSFLISLLITKNTMSPVIRITNEASKISSSNLSTSLALSGYDDEIDALINTFNNLFKRLKYDFDRERQFTSDVSHELKTPIAVILGQTNLLMRWGKDNPEQLEKSLNSIKKESKSMEAIISNLLQISRLENGKIKPKMEDVELGEMFIRLQEEINAISPNVNFEIEKSNNKIKTDSELLHQVLTVIVSNSIKYAGENCSIKISEKRKNSVDEDETTISIEDNGQGFAENVLPHIFERFYRGDEAHTRSAGGSGLGLSIAKVIVETLGGSISAQNTETHGARIIISL